MLLEDLCCFLPADKAQAAFSLLDIDGDGKISLDDMRDAVISIYKERKHLALTLRVWQEPPCMLLKKSDLTSPSYLVHAICNW